MRAEVVVITFPVYGQGRIQKIDPQTGRVLATIPAPSGGGHSGVAWAERRLWVGQYHDRKIHQVDPETGAGFRRQPENSAARACIDHKSLDISTQLL